jgi:hypothetical protein
MRLTRLLVCVLVTGLSSLTVAFASAPPAAAALNNDDFANASVIGPLTSGVTTPVDGTNVGATAEPNEPNSWSSMTPTHTVWYHIIVPGPGKLTLSGTADFAADWEIFIANGTPSLSSIFPPTLNESAAPGGDFGTISDTGPITAYPNAATDFYVQVDSNVFDDPPDDIAMGDFTIDALWTGRPANDDLANATGLNASSDFETGDTTTATKQPSEPLISINTHNYGGHSVWYAETPTVTGRTDVVVAGESGSDPALAVYTDSAFPVTIAGLSLVATDASATITNSDTSDVRFTAMAGVTYYIRVDGQGPPDAAGENGPFTLTLTQIPPPANDNFADATALTTASGSIDGSNISATLETDEPLPAVHSGNETVWYAFAPPTSGPYEFDTPAADRTFPTQIAIWRGSALASLTQIISNDATQSDSATVTFDATAGTTYYVQVAGLDSGTTDGNFTLTWQPAGDSTPPVVTSVSPAAYATVSGVVHITVQASDNVGVTSVGITIDGVLHTLSTPPYEYDWDTTKVPDGQHSILVIARDAANNASYPVTHSVTVQNNDLTSVSISVGGVITIPLGKGARITGQLMDTSTSAPISGATVDLYGKSSASGGPYTKIGSTISSATGGLSIVEKPVHNTVYQWQYAGSASQHPSASPNREISVSAAVSATLTKAKVRRHQSTTLFGVVAPAENGQRVVVQELVRGKWKALTLSQTLKVRRLPNGTRASGYIITLAEAAKGTYSFRVVRAATTTNAAGTSRVVTLTVT